MIGRAADTVGAVCFWAWKHRLINLVCLALALMSFAFGNLSDLSALPVGVQRAVAIGRASLVCYWAFLTGLGPAWYWLRIQAISTIGKDPQRSAKETIDNDQQGSSTIGTIIRLSQQTDPLRILDARFLLSIVVFSVGKPGRICYEPQTGGYSVARRGRRCPRSLNHRKDVMSQSLSSLQISLRTLSIAVGVTLGLPGSLLAQSATDFQALREEMQKMRQQYEQRIEEMDATQKASEQRMENMEAEMQALKTKAASAGSIINTRVLTEADLGTAGKEGKGLGPILDESFLKSLTRHFNFSTYVRAGVMFNGNGGAGDFNFEAPDNFGGRARFGNENDVYMELTWMQSHLLGEGSDVMDVSMRFTPAIVYKTNRATYLDHASSGFDFAMREAYLEMKNVIRSAPEVTFWGGQRFYDRYQIEPHDYYYLDSSGYGAGAYNIDLGIGKLWIAYLGGIEDSIANEDLGQNAGFTNFISPELGNFYKHTLDIRLKDIDIGFGKLALVVIGNYQKGGNFEITNSGFASGPEGTLTTQDAYGIGGGAIWRYEFGKNSFLMIAGMFGIGATNFSTDVSLPQMNSAFQNAIATGHATANPDGTFDASVNPLRDSREYHAIVDYNWDVTDNFTLHLWGIWSQNSQGFQTFGTDADGDLRIAASTRNMYGFGIRPIFWVADNFAIEASAYGSYQDNNRGYNGTDAFGRSGSMGIFSIGPVIKPKGGYFTRPELRFFATYAIWSDSLRGSTTPINEGGNFGGAIAPYNDPTTNQGWLFGTQVEWFF